MAKHTGTTHTPVGLNTLLLVVGLAIVWLATHSGIALLGAFIAAIHIEIREEGGTN